MSVDKSYRCFPDYVTDIVLYTGCIPLLNTLVTFTGVVAPVIPQPSTVSPICISAILLYPPSARLTFVSGCRQLTPACVSG